MHLQKLIFTSGFLFIYLWASCQLTDSVKVNALLDESTKLFFENGPRSVELADQAEALSEKINFKKGKALALKNKGIVSNLQGKSMEVLDYWNESLNLFKEIGDKKGEANLLSNIGTVFNTSGDNVKALDYFLKGLKIAEEIGDKQRLYILYNNIGNVYQIRKDYNQALDYYLNGIHFVEQMGDSQSELLAAMYVNVGSIYTVKENPDFEKAKEYLDKSLVAYGSSDNRVNSYNYLGDLSLAQGKYHTALRLYTQAMQIAEKTEASIPMIHSFKGLARVNLKLNDLAKAISFYRKAETQASAANIPTELSEIYKFMSIAYSNKNDYPNAFKYQQLYTTAQDSLYKNETNRKLGIMQFDFELEKKENEISLLTKDKELQENELKRQRFAKNAFMVGFILVFMITYIIFRNYRNKVKVNRILDQQKDEIEQLLLNILPAEVAKELQATGSSTPKTYEHVSVLFTDFKGFTLIADKLSPEELVFELNACFEAFDDIILKNGLEKIKTDGDAYMCAGGIPITDNDHPFRIVNAALEIRDYISKTNDKRRQLGQDVWEIRIGIHVGPLTAGVVGKKKYAYDIWGSTVNIASRMESSGIPGQVNVSAATYEIVKDKYNCVYRGKIYAKNVGEIDMYLIDVKKGELGKIMTDIESIGEASKKIELPFEPESTLLQ